MEAAAVDDGSFRVELPEPGLTDSILSLFFPPRCVHCGAPGGWLCRGCAGGLMPAGPGSCRRCGKPAPSDLPDCRECRGRDLGFERARAAFCFDGPARSLVHALKYQGRRRLAAFMAALGDNNGVADLTAAGTDVTLTYVPLHRSKLISRGYNQAELYARALSRRHRLPVKNLLLKLIPTQAQNRLDARGRGVNLAGSFALRRPAACTDRVILVDDVYTTGSTAAACATVLRDQLGARVDVWTFARTVRAR